MPDYDLIVRGGLVATPGVGMVRTDLGVRAGRVAAVGIDLPGSARETLEAGGLWVFPGLVDPHTHMGNHFPFKDDLATETRAAALGGVTTLVTTLRRSQFHSPPLPYLQFFREALAAVEGVSSVDWATHFTLSPTSPMEEIQACYEQLGTQSYKALMAGKDRPVDSAIDLDQMLLLLQQVAAMPHPPLVMVHCEDEHLVQVSTRQARAAGLQGLAAWNTARPNLAEELAIRQICGLARYTGARVYVVHVTTREGAAVIAEERRRGAPIIAETNVQYLTLTTDTADVVAKINPPIRERADVEALWRALEEGTITTIGSDHVARPSSMKEGTIWEASLSFPGMETLLPMVLTGLRQRSMPVERVAELCSLNVAKTFGLFPRKGHLAPGADADLVLVDPDRRQVIRAADLQSVATHTPYEGMESWGWPVATVLRGRVVAKDGVLLAERTGQFLPVYPQPMS